MKPNLPSRVVAGRLAYFAPELPATSATFVYQELLAIERRGYWVLPVTLRKPESPAVGHESLAARTVCLRGMWQWKSILNGLLTLCSGRLNVILAFKHLLHDLSVVSVLDVRFYKLIFNFIESARLATMILDYKCCHIHVHFAHVPAQIGMYSAALAGIPFTVTAHANDIFVRNFLLLEKARRSAKFLTVSKYNIEYLRKFRLPEEKLGVVRCGVSLPSPAKWPVANVKSAYRIGTLGRLVEKKGVETLLNAVAGMPEVYLSIAGDGPLRAELEAHTNDLGIASRVEFVGSLSHHAVADWMAGLDLFALACKQDRNGDMDGIPVVLMEAMSQGIPVVSTRLSGIPELVIHEKTGLLAMPGDSDDLRQQITRMFASSELRTQLAHAAAAHVSSEFGQEVNVDRLLRHFGFASE